MSESTANTPKRLRRLVGQSLRWGWFYVYRSWLHLSREALRKPPYFIRYQGYDLAYEPGDHVVVRILAFGGYEKDVFQYLRTALEPGAAVVDVGANVGLFSLAVARMAPDATLHCFEPSPSPRACLTRTLERNDLGGRIRLNGQALYKEPGELEFHVHDGGNAAFDGIRDTGRVGGARSIRVPVTTLDHYAREVGLDRLDLLKIDTEGAELFVLQGAVETLRRLRPRIILEADPTNMAAYGVKPQEAYRFLREQGYRVKDLRGRTLEPADFDRSLAELEVDFLAVPDGG